MNETQKRRLEYLKEKQRKLWHTQAIAMEKRCMIESIPNFEKQYAFADVEQINGIMTFLHTLPAMTPTRPDFRILPKEEIPYKKIENDAKTVFVCFLHGIHAVFDDLFVMGTLGQCCKDMVYWQDLCEDLLLILDNFQDFIYIEGRHTPIKSKWEKPKR